MDRVYRIHHGIFQKGTKMNPPVKSKINWTALVMALVGVASALGYVSEDNKAAILEVTVIAGPVLIATFRTWFT